MKIAVVLFNLGGPLNQKAVRPFLWNLFKDPHIIRLPALLRYPLAFLISTLRTQKAKAIYRQIGGGSPLNEKTKAQALALEENLVEKGLQAKVFMCMRYAPPFTKEVVRAVRDSKPDAIILLPLYPQFSTTTTKSSFHEWDKYAKDLLSITQKKCCYPLNEHFIKAHQQLIANHIKTIKAPLKLLFSAHGIPLDIVESGDPYAFQVEATVNAIMHDPLLASIPYQICYQSRVGPKKWLSPTIDEALHLCQKSNLGAVVVPISFVSDHSETLVELDIQYKDRAKELSLCHYSRVEALGTDRLFIDSLAESVLELVENTPQKRLCPPSFKECGCM